ncbi:hypothetical protein GGF32_003211 [Allomyces javanicus]|nr:hypothetical protein GGF32_003211 [Allomyces javanicus]
MGSSLSAILQPCSPLMGTSKPRTGERQPLLNPENATVGPITDQPCNFRSQEQLERARRRVAKRALQRANETLINIPSATCPIAARIAAAEAAGYTEIFRPASIYIDLPGPLPSELEPAATEGVLILTTPPSSSESFLDDEQHQRQASVSVLATTFDPCATQSPPAVPVSTPPVAAAAAAADEFGPAPNLWTGVVPAGLTSAIVPPPPAQAVAVGSAPIVVQELLPNSAESLMVGKTMDKLLTAMQAFEVRYDKPLIVDLGA